jgi:hypothetical protein
MYGFSGFLPFVYILSLLFGERKNLSLCELNKKCGVHSFDLNGIKNGSIVIDDTTEVSQGDPDVILFRGCGPRIDGKLNSSLATRTGWFNVYRKIEPGVYVYHGKGKRCGNYWARIRDYRIVYVFPIRITTDRYTPMLFWWL